MHKSGCSFGVVVQRASVGVAARVVVLAVMDDDGLAMDGPEYDEPHTTVPSI